MTAKVSIVTMTRSVEKILLLWLLLTAWYLSRAIPARDNPDTRTDITYNIKTSETGEYLKHDLYNIAGF